MKRDEFIVCDECGTWVLVDDAEAAYNEELDTVFWTCSKCIYDEKVAEDTLTDEDE